MAADFFAQCSAFRRRLFELASAKGNVFASFHQYNDIGRGLGFDETTTATVAAHLYRKRELDMTHDLDVWLTSSGLDAVAHEAPSARPTRAQEPSPGMPPAFLAHAADVLADTTNGLGGADLARLTRGYAVQWNVLIPHPTYPFGPGVPNKRTALYENLLAFDPVQQYRVIRELCDHPALVAKAAKAVAALKLTLIGRYGELAGDVLGPELDAALVERTQHFLAPFPSALALYDQAMQKHANGLFLRNVLDDLRLALELLLQVLLTNDRSLENQIPALGAYVKQRGGSPEFANMFGRLVDYYTKYQNSYVKHDDAVIEEEVEFVFELTSSFMKHLVRLSYRRPV